MLCERCGQSEATHHDIVVNAGQVRETHLCEACAREATGTGQTPATLGEWLTNFVLTPPHEAPPEPGAADRCPACGLLFSQLKKSGLVGCGRCYSAFEGRLAPLIQRAHEGGSRHVGKSPRRRGAAELTMGPESAAGPRPTSRADQIAALRAQLAQAVEVEAYERAAQIRDQLRGLLGPGEPAP